MYEVWYDYIQPKYYQNADLCYMDTDSLIVYTMKKFQIMLKKKDFWRTKLWNQMQFHWKASNNKQKLKVIELMKNELDGKIMT